MKRFSLLDPRRLTAVVAAVLVAVAAALPARADDLGGGLAPGGGDGGWINLPSGTGGGGEPGGSSSSGAGTSLAGGRPSLVGIVATGEAAPRTLEQVPSSATGVRVDEMPGAVRVEGTFAVELDVALLRDGGLSLDVADPFLGGIAVVHAAGLPAVPFGFVHNRLVLPGEALLALAEEGIQRVALRFLPPTLDKLVVMDLSLSRSGDGSYLLALSSEVR